MGHPEMVEARQKGNRRFLRSRWSVGMTVHGGGIGKLKRGEMVWVRAFPLMPCGMNGAPRDGGGASERQPQIPPLPLVGRNDSAREGIVEAKTRGDGLGSCFPTHA